jgi:SHS family lactate transporter-like MFS transporter
LPSFADFVGFNFLSHGSQDLYPTYLKVTKSFTDPLASKTTIVSNCGAIVGGTIAGYTSQYLGRRLAILCLLIYTALWIPLWILPNSFAGLTAGGFFMQSGVQGAWGIVPIFLSEIAPPAFRASFAGIAYQLGNMASSAAAQIEAEAGKTLRLPGTTTPDYATIQGILIGAVIAWMIVCVFLGPEANGAHFEQAKVSFQDGAGNARAADLVNMSERERREMAIEKGRDEFVENRA